MTVEKSLELIEYARLLKEQEDERAIQGMLDTLVILFGENDSIVNTTRTHLNAIINK